MLRCFSLFFLLMACSTPPEPTVLPLEGDSYDVGWPGPDPDVHRKAVGQALLGPIGMLGEWSHDGWSISFGPLVPEAVQWFKVAGGYILMVTFDQISYLELTVDFGQDQYTWKSGPAVTHVIPLMKMEPVSLPTNATLKNVRFRRMGGQFQEWKK